MRRTDLVTSIISPAGRILSKLSSRIQKTRLAFAILRHPWRWREIRLSVKRRAYIPTIRSVLSYGSETWPLRAENMERLLVFEYYCIRSIGKI